MASDNKNCSDNIVNPQENDTFSSEFSHLYKNTGKGVSLSQRERRELILKEQKEKRHSIVDSHRDLTELFLEDDSNDVQEVPEDMDVDLQSSRKPAHQFRHMKSEWFCEVPEDLEKNWLAKCCPEGFRVLIICKKGRTIVWNEKGKVITLKTHLPGGGLDRPGGLTVLDAIYNKVTKTIFILDCLFWNNMSMLDSETIFRFYWIKNKFDESCKLSETNKPHKIYLMHFLPAERSIIQDKLFEILNVSNQQVLYDGVVFYHKEVHYTFGETPLLGWLFTYMLPEKLGIDIPQENLAKMPKDYECLEKYLELKQQKAENRMSFKSKRLKKQNMDTS